MRNLHRRLFVLAGAVLAFNVVNNILGDPSTSQSRAASNSALLLLALGLAAAPWSSR